MNQLQLFDEQCRPIIREPAPHSGTQTSMAAAEAIEPAMNRLQQVVLEFVVQCGERGATREEIELGLEMTGNTVRPRVKELQRRGSLRVCDDTRTTRSGRAANVLRAPRFCQ
jgi:hypothetical protein